jgi:uncharacterized protein with GYD domain
MPLRERKKPMPNYVCLFDWTDQGVRNARDTVERVAGAAELAESKYGVRLGQIYWTVGPHDLVGVFEAPDDESLSAFLLELAAAGNVRSTTLRAYDSGEMSGIIGRLG